MYQEQWMESKRKVRRKDMPPDGISLGHKVKNFMTVIGNAVWKMGSYQILENSAGMQDVY